ncbi:spectrin beta chain, non-erythrocytic 5-like isoform X2 [Acanthaster planci]|uniref:Spectrin beta chain, non-erythrocytic 5-like isoform X2 n=1 Tax=Acanthaster planci TaxID=133434 RepID=A0A8B7YH16_ACAPL|nr:spectrin beta chain, non-erythrocytic 5-like isoform X2 [Acanthaster planci]
MANTQSPAQAASSFEKGRIQALQEERIKIQKKTFTKWVNSFLEKANLRVKDLFVDLQDGKVLLRLLEIISGEKLGRPNKGALRVQKMENVGKALTFLSSKVRLESIGSEDIVDGNPRLTLGLMWTIILRFQIQDIQIEDEGSTEKRSAKEALLLWCQRKTTGYRGVNIHNFTTSWRNGLAFNALIHVHRPELVSFEGLVQRSNEQNLNMAFTVAKEQLGIPDLLDAEDVDVEKPDEKSIMTYVASYYHYFAKMKTEKTGGKRIAKIVSQLMDVDKMRKDYELMVSQLLEWIEAKIRQLADHKFPNSLDGIQALMQTFKEYRTVEKPPKYAEWANIEVAIFNIQALVQSCHLRQYMPPEGKLVSDVERCWGKLEQAEHDRGIALREELIRQERLERLAEKFARKALLRESWLADMTSVLKESVIPSNNIFAVEAATKRHEAITADVMARKDRFEDLSRMAKELVGGNHHTGQAVSQKERKIARDWQKLIDLLARRQQVLHGFTDLMGMFREIESVTAEMKEIEVGLQSGNCGKHLLGVEDLLQRHALTETQINSQGYRVGQVNQKADIYLSQNHSESETIKKRVALLNVAYEHITKLSMRRKAQLEESLKFFEFLRDGEEEESWLTEKQRIAKSMVTGRDLRSVINAQQKHAALELEIVGRQQIIEGVMQTGEELARAGHPSSNVILAQIDELQEKWARLNEFAEARKYRLEQAAQSHQYYIDTNEAESWMREKMPLVCSDDYGKDPESAKTLLQKHLTLMESINAYEDDILKLSQQAKEMVDANMNSKFSLEPLAEAENAPEPFPAEGEEYVTEIVEVPYEVEEEEVVEKEVVKEVVEERTYPQVKAAYAFSGQGLKVSKGEILILVEKTNADWWNIRKASGQEGFVPANYVKETQPKVVKKKVQKRVRVPETVRVRKTKMRQEMVKRKRKISAGRGTSLSRKSSLRRTNHFDKENIELRQQGIDGTYRRLKKLAVSRKRYLEDAIKLFSFYRECDEFQAWMKEKYPSKLVMIIKEKILKKKETLSERVEASRRKFENLLTDLVANQGRIDRINKMADEFVRTGHSKQAEVLGRQKEVNDQWERLMKLKEEKEKMLEGASSIELYNHSWGEAKEWILDKFNALSSYDPGKDSQSVQDLQRKHENLERELAPVSEKLRKLNLLAKAVKSSYPNEGDHIDQRQAKIRDLWDTLEAKAAERKAQLEQSRDISRFHNETKELTVWCNEVRGLLLDTELARDVVGSENLLKQHQDLLEDVRGHDDIFTKLEALGRQLLKALPDSVTIAQRTRKLSESRTEIQAGWDKRNQRLQDALDLALFNREADQIDARTSGHEAFLEFEDLGATVEIVYGLIKRQEDFENTLTVQDERLQGLKEIAAKLVNNNHYARTIISNRCEEVVARRLKVKENSALRRQKLLQSREFLEFCRDADELSEWIYEKHEIACDESFRELTNLPRKVKKHEAFEAELTANKDSLDKLNETGQALIQKGNFKASDVKATLTALNDRWADLNARSSDKGVKLRQATQQQGLNRALEDAVTSIAEMEVALSSQDLGQDLRSVKGLIKKHQLLESDMAVQADKIAHIVEQAHLLTEEGHFDAERIAIETAAVTDRFAQLGQPSERRRSILADSHKLQVFLHDVNSEAQWIKEHLPAASSTDYGKTFTACQSHLQKHKKLRAELTGHQPVIDKVIQAGQALIDSGHFAAATTQENCQELSVAWGRLFDAAEERERRLHMAFEAQQYFAEADEAESWIGEKMSLATSIDYGNSEDATQKLLARNKALKLDVENYHSVLKELEDKAKAMVASSNPHGEELMARQENLQKRLKSLQDAVAERAKELEGAKLLHEYVRESDELGEWIEVQYQAASSEEFGEDLEHLERLKNKHDEFQRRIDTGNDKFKQCEDQAQRLIQDKHPLADTIQEKQDSLKQALEMLRGQVQERTQKLEAAGQIHKFNRDFEDSMSRIQEKYHSMPEDLGKDIISVQSLIRKHETFENDLLAMEGHLQNLVNDAAKLQEEYPGGNAEQIVEQQQVIVTNWNTLQEHATQRRELLQAANDWQRLLATCRDLISWTNETMTEMMTEEPIRDVASASAALSQHAQVRAEIDAREENFASLVEAGQMLIKQQHYASEEIQEKLDAALQAREQLHSSWQAKKDRLEQVAEQQVFLRDAKQLDTISAQQEAYLAGAGLAATVEEVDALVKKHEDLEKLLAAQEEKGTALGEFAHKLIAQDHFDAPAIRNKFSEVLQRRAKVKEISGQRKQSLTTAKMYAQFKRDLAEADTWVDEKHKILVEDCRSLQDMSNLQEKMKKLQKHQAFEAEIAANEKLIAEVKKAGDLVIAEHHPDSSDIQHDLKELLDHWEALRRASARRSQQLDEVKDLLEFNRQAEKVESWIKEKELMVLASDCGRDYEHCFELQKKLDDLGADMSVDESVVKQLSLVGEKLIHQAQAAGEGTVIKERRDSITMSWQQMQEGLADYRTKLAGALEVHAFNRDVDEIKERIIEKANAMSSEELGKDLPGVESLQRRHQDMIQDLTAIEDKLQEVDAMAERLSASRPESIQEIQTKQREAAEKWEALRELTKVRQARLDAAYNLQKFNKDFREMDNWASDIVTRMTSGELAKSVPEAENMCELHKERKVEIDGRDGMFQYLRGFGERLIQQDHYAKEELRASLKRLQDTKDHVVHVWQERKGLLAQCFDLQVFQDYVEQAEVWLASKEAFLHNEDIGDSLTSADALVKKHEGFEKTLQTQAEKIEELQSFASELVQGSHFDIKNINNRCRDVLGRRDRLWAQANARHRRLHESKQLHQFLQSIYEMLAWIGEKLQVAQDEAYRDPSNLQGKIQKHQAFEAELMANKDRVDAITQEGTEMISANHFAAEDIQGKLTLMEEKWQQLVTSSMRKRDLLNDAYQAQVFHRSLDDLLTWLTEMESQLASKDLGRDLSSVNKLLKKHSVMEAQMNAHEEKVTDAKTMADSFREANHFLSEELTTKTDQIVVRYEALREPLNLRRGNLEDAHRLYQFHRDVEDEVSWIDQKQPWVASDDLGTSLHAVQSLYKKHQALEAELTAHEPLISAVVLTGKQLIQGNHYALEDINVELSQLQAMWYQLQEVAGDRKRKLLDALESQTFYSEVSEAESWMKEKRPLLTSPDYGKDEDSVASLLKKLDALDLDLESFQKTIDTLASLSSGLLARGHFDSADIKQRQSDVEASYKELLALSHSRRKALSDHKELYEFYSETEETADWIQDQEAVASSEDYGKDLEHVEILQVKFGDFTRDLLANAHRVASVGTRSLRLVDEGIGEEKEILERCHRVEEMWEQLKELTNARTEALAAAKLIHAFDRDSDETRSWIQEKEKTVSSEDYGHDLASVQALIRRHNGLERDLAALEEQVASVSTAAAQLVERFPHAFDRISHKNDTVVEAWNLLLEEAATRRDRLAQAEQLQTYLNDYREMSAWMSEMMALITTHETPHDVHSAESLLGRHAEHKAEIDGRTDSLEQFTSTGRELIDNGHFLSNEISDKVEQLKHSWDDLLTTWHEKQALFDTFLDAQVFERELEQAETWLAARNPVLQDQSFLEDTLDIEEMIKRHEDFEKTIAAQEEKFAALKRQTKCEEQSFGHQKQLDNILEEVNDAPVTLRDIASEDTEMILEEDENLPGTLGEAERAALVAQIEEELFEEELQEKLQAVLPDDESISVQQKVLPVQTKRTDLSPEIKASVPVPEKPLANGRKSEKQSIISSALGKEHLINEGERLRDAEKRPPRLNGNPIDISSPVTSIDELLSEDEVDTRDLIHQAEILEESAKLPSNLRGSERPDSTMAVRQSSSQQARAESPSGRQVEPGPGLNQPDSKADLPHPSSRSTAQYSRSRSSQDLDVSSDESIRHRKSPRNPSTLGRIQRGLTSPSHGQKKRQTSKPFHPSPLALNNDRRPQQRMFNQTTGPSHKDTAVLNSNNNHTNKGDHVPFTKPDEDWMRREGEELMSPDSLSGEEDLSVGSLPSLPDETDPVLVTRHSVEKDSPDLLWKSDQSETEPPPLPASAPPQLYDFEDSSPDEVTTLPQSPSSPATPTPPMRRRSRASSIDVKKADASTPPQSALQSISVNKPHPATALHDPSSNHQSFPPQPTRPAPAVAHHGPSSPALQGPGDASHQPPSPSSSPIPGSHHHPSPHHPHISISHTIAYEHPRGHHSHSASSQQHPSHRYQHPTPSQKQPSPRSHPTQPQQPRRPAPASPITVTHVESSPAQPRRAAPQFSPRAHQVDRVTAEPPPPIQLTSLKGGHHRPFKSSPGQDSPKLKRNKIFGGLFKKK